MIMGFKTKLVAAIGGGFLVLLVIAFLFPSDIKYSCYSVFKFQYDETDYVSSGQAIEKELLENIDGRIDLPRLNVYSTSFPNADPPQSKVFTLEFELIYQENSTEMQLVRDSLEKIPEISDLSGPSTWCPPE